MGRGEEIVHWVAGKLPAVVIGIVAAVVTSLTMDHVKEKGPDVTERRQESNLAPSTTKVRDRVIRSVVVDRDALDRIGELEKQLQEMREAKAASAVQLEPEQPSVDPEEVRRRSDQLFAELDQTHEQEPPDPGWAPSATKGLTNGLESLGEKLGFSVGPTDCKMTSCRASVTWTNYTTARATGAQLAERIFGGLNCAQRIRLPEPADSEKAYTTQLYLDCTDLRAGVADELLEARAN